MDERQVAAYLHMDLREVVKLASRGRIPCRKVRGQFQFHKSDVDHWVETQMHALGRRRLAKIEEGVSAHHGFDAAALLVGPLIPRGGLAVPLKAKTRDAAIRGLADLACAAELVYDKDLLVREIREREELCSTALVPGVALPHPRHPLPYDIAASFVTVGLTSSGIPYGAADGSLTRLFFLICCKDDRTHLHVLARLGQMLHERPAVDELLSAESAEQLAAMLRRREQAALGT
jgi:PTS system nitrogen regulatory IIA component